MEIKDVGQRITKLRKEKGWSQMTLAEKLNVSDKAVSKWENGGLPGIDLFPKMAELFDVSIDYLMIGKEDDTPEEEGVHNDTNVPQAPEKVTSAPSDSGIPEEYLCPKCNKVNHRPGKYCVFCYHEFDFSKPIEIKMEETYEVETIEYDEVTKNPICPKCHKVNPYPDTHCAYCYHEFGKRARPSATPRNVNPRTGFFNTGSQKTYLSSAHQPTYTTTPSSQAGCLMYLIAFLFPLIGLIWGLVKNEKGVTVFSVVLIVIELFIWFISTILGGLIALGASFVLPAGGILIWC